MSKQFTEFEKFEGQNLTPEESLKRSKEWFEFVNQRRSVRQFSSDPIPKEVIENCIKAASSAPSGAHKQPWTFCVISNPEVKAEIREKAEKEEYENYHGRMSQEWLQDLMPFRTDWNKPFLVNAPYLIIVFKQVYAPDKSNHYYVNESVGIATGFLINALHRSGLVTLSHTPSPMKFLNVILDRPSYEKPFLLIPVGYPAKDVEIPILARKPLDDVSVWFE